MKYSKIILLFIPLFLVIAFCIYMDIQESKKEKPFKEIVDLGNGRHIYSLEIEGHSYMMYRNSWNSNSDRIIHSPNCECMNSM
jgi:hypothetical protein